MTARRPIRTTQADCEIRGGEFVAYDRANYQTALQVWMGQAEGGDAEAQNYVGEIYAKGLGTQAGVLAGDAHFDVVGRRVTVQPPGHLARVRRHGRPPPQLVGGR